MSCFTRGSRALTGLVLVVLATACASSVERSTRSDLRRVEGELAALPSLDDEAQAQDVPTFDGSLSSYLAYAFAHNPGLRASFEQWRARTYAPRQARRLPEPTLSFAGFVRAVETRVGPQRARLGAMQWFPWPTKLSASGKAAAYEARASQDRFEAHALEIAAEVARPYWTLWQVERVREVERDQIVVLSGLSEQVRARLEVGAADLSDLAQLDLMLARARDRLDALDEMERIASAELVRAVGAPPGTPTPVDRDAPHPAVPTESLASLSRAAAEHPRVESMAAMSQASSERARAARAERFPRFGIGVDWIITGESPAATPPPDSGKDAVAIVGSLSVPLWQRSYSAGVDEAEAHETAFRARALDARNRVVAEAQAHLARVRDDVRRAQLYETTLVPQAETAFESVVGSYASGRSTIAELLIAERELLDLQRELFEAQADFAVDLAELERVVGRPVETKGADRGTR